MKKLATGIPRVFGWRLVATAASAKERLTQELKQLVLAPDAPLFSYRLNLCSIRVIPALAKIKTCILMDNKTLAPLIGNLVKGS